MSLVRMLHGRRRVLALVQLLLFVFSSSTMLLPCAHASETSRTIVSADRGDAMDQQAMHHDAMHHDTRHGATSPAAPAHHAPGVPDTACPWVVGCVGMLQFELDATWRSIEFMPLTAAPIGVTLGYVTTDRDIESPPPRV